MRAAAAVDPVSSPRGVGLNVVTQQVPTMTRHAAACPGETAHESSYMVQPAVLLQIAAPLCSAPLSMLHDHQDHGEVLLRIQRNMHVSAWRSSITAF